MEARPALDQGVQGVFLPFELSEPLSAASSSPVMLMSMLMSASVTATRTRNRGSIMSNNSSGKGLQETLNYVAVAVCNDKVWCSVVGFFDCCGETLGGAACLRPIVPVP